jgi:hypothetical protein
LIPPTWFLPFRAWAAFILRCFFKSETFPIE